MSCRLAVWALALLAAASCGGSPDRSAIVSSGHVEATEVHVSTKIGGTLAALPVAEGDVVTAGQTLARIDTVDLELAATTARAERGEAAAALALVLAGARREDVADAAAQVSRAEADLAAADRDLTRFEGLSASGSGTEKALDDARTRRKVAAETLESARQRLAKLHAGSRPEDIAAARARVAAADARIAQIEQQVEDATVICPTAGVVTSKLVEQGEVLPPGAPLLVVTELARPWLTVYVAESDLGSVRLGEAAEVVTDGGEKRTGHVTFIASQAEFTPKNVQTRDERVKLVYKLKITLDNPDGLFKPGMPAEARLRPAAGGGAEAGS